MKENELKQEYPLFHVTRGNVVDAAYNDPMLEDYRNNPLIEALPPIWDVSTVIKQLASRPRYHISENELPSHLRLHCVQRITRDFFQPLSRHIELEQQISRLLRDGYVGRNPMSPHYAFHVRKDAYNLITSGNTEGYQVINPSSSGFALVGISGIGKSTALVRILSMYPQVITHKQYKNQGLTLYQIVWLKMDCPHDGSIRGLCLNFFLDVDGLVGGNYYKKHAASRKTVDELLPIMAQLAATHCLGVLIIDEIQNLIEAKAGLAPKMLNFFVQLVNTIGLSVIVVGTFKALPILNGEFRNARRGTGQGDFTWDRLEHDEEWEHMLTGLWKYQWTKERVKLTDDFIKVMYEESQGITDIAVKLFMIAQWRAIDQDIMSITPSLIRSVAKDRLQLLREALQALKTGDKQQIAKFGDLYSSVSAEDYFKEIEAKQKRKEHLAIIKEELDSTGSIQVVNEISNWLTQAGIQQEIANDVANKVVDDNLDKLNDIDLNQQALKLALFKTEDIRRKSRITNKKRIKILPIEAADLRFICSHAKEHKITAYDALKKANYIADLKKFWA